MTILAPTRASDVARLAENAGPADIWVAAGPEAMGTLDRQGTSYLVPEDLCPTEDILRACETRVPRFLAACDEADARLQADDAVLRRWGIRPFGFHFDELASAGETVFAAAMELAALGDRFPGARVRVVRPAPTRERFGDTVMWQPHESPWALVLGLPDSAIDVDGVPGHAGRGREFSFRRALGATLTRRPALLSAIRSVTRGGHRNAVGHAVASAVAPAGWVLAIGALEEWAELIPWFRQRGLGVLFWSEPPHGPAVAPPDWTRAAGDAFLTAWMPVADRPRVDLRPLLTSRARWVATTAGPYAHETIRGLEQLCARRPLRLALASTASTFASRVVRAWCRARGVPVVGWQHGSVWHDGRGVTERSDWFDLAHNTVCLAYGEGSRGAYERSTVPERAPTVSVGSVRLDALSRDRGALRRASGRRVLYVAANYVGPQWYAGVCPLSDRRLYRAQSRLAARLRALGASGASVTIKLHPAFCAGERRPAWATEAPGCQLVGRRPSVTTLLRSHDALVVDLPTTAMLEGLSTSLPVFLLTAVMQPPAEHLVPLGRRVVHHADEDALMDAVTQWVGGGPFEADVADREFLRLYGTHLDDGRTAERVQALLGQWVDRPVPHTLVDQRRA